MKKITIGNKQYDCPTSWFDITISQQLAVSRDSDAIENDVLKKLAIISGYCNIPLATLKRLHMDELPPLFKHIEFINTPIPEAPVSEFDFKGGHYYVAQNLFEIEFQDFISIENALQENSGHTYQALPMLLAIMCKQKKEDGTLETINDYSLQERCADFYSLPISIANGLAFFLSTSVNLYKMASQLYSKPEALMEAAILSLKDMQNPRAGKGLLTRCVNGIWRYWIKYIQRKLRRHYISTPAK
jgi:hypothetical protein